MTSYTSSRTLRSSNQHLIIMSNPITSRRNTERDFLIISYADYKTRHLQLLPSYYVEAVKGSMMEGCVGE